MAKVVDNVSLQVSRGEYFGLVGESDSGKFIADRCTLNLSCPTSGKVYFDGKPIFNEEKGIALNRREMMGCRKEIQITFRDLNVGLSPHMTVDQITEEGIKKYRIATGKGTGSLIAYHLKLYGLSRSIVSYYPSQFSSRREQRTGITWTLAVKPRFIVAGKPLSALDISIQSRVLNLTGELREKPGLTYLYISHNLKTVEYFCGKVGILYLGILLEADTTKETMTEPFHPYTRALFSAVPPEDLIADGSPEWIKLIGGIPSATNMPSGYKLYIRCPRTTDEYRGTEPRLACMGGAHFTACRHWQETSHR